MILNHGIDWLTLTNVYAGKESYPPLLVEFSELAGVTEKWKQMGYVGSQDKDKSIRYGSRRREDGRSDEILIVSGGEAEWAAREIYEPLQYRATRVDLQVTVELEEEDRNLVACLYTALHDLKDEGEDRTKRRKVVLLRGGEGETLYIGSRKTGRKFFRLYDKSIDVGKGLGQVWRQEVQYGRDLAQGAFVRYLLLRDKPVSLISLVSAEFQDAMGFTLTPDPLNNAELVLGKPKKKTTLRKKLEWLEKCVRPTVAFLIAHDLEEEMFQALGLGKTRDCKQIEN